MDDAERIARRYEPGEFAIRRSRAIALGRDVRENESIILGSENPELLLTWELMLYVKSTYYPVTDLQRVIGRRIRQRAASLGLNEDFFDRLHTVAQPYFHAENELRRLDHKLRGMAKDDPSLQQIADERRRANKLICPARASAARAARSEFGREQFDRFLYEAVAPDASVTVVPAKDREAWLWYDGGCQ